jgi:hypothetical protein
MMRGLQAPANGWFSRAEELSTVAGPECPAPGWLPRSPTTRRAPGTWPSAPPRSGSGAALIAMGEPTAGAVNLECMGVYDLRRASEWTNALAAWCNSRPDMVPFRGQCLVHRSQLEQAEGDWPAAVSSAQSACLRLAATCGRRHDDCRTADGDRDRSRLGERDQCRILLRLLRRSLAFRRNKRHKTSPSTRRSPRRCCVGRPAPTARCQVSERVTLAMRLRPAGQ